MLIGLHIGLHYNMIVKLKKNKKIILNIMLIIFGFIFGIKGFIEKQFIEKITLQSLFPAYFEDNIFLFIIDYLGILVMFMMIGYGIYNLISLKKKK